jgi:tyrosine-protein kinase Etk/Wzc
MLRQPTVVVEMDMRLPRLHELVGCSNAVGLSNYLNGEVELAEILQPVAGYPNLFIIPSGPLPPDPSELLSGPAMAELIRSLRDQFRYVVLDAPPVGIVTDAQVVAPYVDETLFVVRHGVTPRQSMKLLNTLHREQRFPNLSVILNDVGSGDAYHFNRRYQNSYAYR